MKRLIYLFILSLFCGNLLAQESPIFIETNNTALVYKTDRQNKLMQVYFGEKLNDADEYSNLFSQNEAYMPAGMDNLYEPAIRLLHNDGNPSLSLKFEGVEVSRVDENVSVTQITLKDDVYPVEVKLFFKAFKNEDVIEAWTEIQHNEKKPVMLTHFASSMLQFDKRDYWLTQFHGDWAKEMLMQESQLTSGIKVIDSKLGTRANKFQAPMFFLSMNEPSTETKGEVVAATLAWTGNFQFNFEITPTNTLRVISGMNPYASEYHLKPNEIFKTPDFIFTYSFEGKGQASRNLHKWAQKYQVLDGEGERLTLLNNWEATYFDFNEDRLVELFDGAKKLGVDLFLLDDGWFANKYPRNNDRAGLGDWQENKEKLPHGIGYLVEQAEAKGIKFGIWIEPEMVNPKSELYENHPDWILKLPNRPEHYSRNQLVLDMANPEVQKFVYDVVDQMLTKHPEIGFIKWDCNREMTNEYSQYLGENQSHIYIDYVKGFYNVMEDLREKYPELPIMLCSGGGGRTDYGAMKYFTEFWPSDNTDAYDRIFIQWAYSYFFPANTICNHITSMGNQSLKFRTDVAMMDKMGYDIRVEEFTDEELAFSQQALKDYDRLKDVIWFGDMYRLISPYEESRAALMYVHESKEKAVFFCFDIYTYRENITNPVKFQGLDPDKKYEVKEINVQEGRRRGPFMGPNAGDSVYSGDYLMKIGYNVRGGREDLSSHVYEITEVN
ncbi:alpha-galactosidase [Maribellus comscasis]|uniref:Alpha-galactosidase n=1 Tax=Maribellus comscasis TaxID=2681766 RepID=A0A6I6JR48_9BACT|nr:alpha-galactosidase [Maribellus comscasis]QGY42453.1 alpha-galactosidase [Maribellus comscasis]